MAEIARVKSQEELKITLPGPLRVRGGVMLTFHNESDRQMLKDILVVSKQAAIREIERLLSQYRLVDVMILTDGATDGEV